MQTFIVTWSPCWNPSFLDNKRLGKQRVECLQILNALQGKSKGWRHHPAVLMWAGYEDMLKVYMDYMIAEWVSRGFKNTMAFNYPSESLDQKYLDVGLPSWWGNPRIIDSHQSNLIRKDPVFYGAHKWSVPDDLPYYWPVTKEDLILKEVMRHCV